MIIVSQDKEEIVNFDLTCNMFVFGDNGIRCMLSDGSDTIIGEYKTKERAIQVLGEIIEFYEDTKQKMMLKNIYVLDADAADFVYYMPKE